MKNKIILLLLFAGMLVSCNKWLDVEPTNQISKDKLFLDEVGIQNALNGIYQTCAESKLYGKNLSWGMLSGIAQNYATADDKGIQYMMEYEYDRAQSLTIIDNVWKGLYNAIASTNLLLKVMSKTPSSTFTLDTLTKDVIIGEALALRAFCHLDLVRMFAPAPIKDVTAKLIPYHDTYPSELTIPSTTTAILERVIEDLLEAKDLLAYNDTVFHLRQMYPDLRTRFDGLYTAIGGQFFNKRGYRMNFHTIIGLLSRAYLYKGDVDNALKYAQFFYDTYIKELKYYKFHKSSDYSTSMIGKTKKTLDECIFAFYNASLLDNIENYYQTSTTKLPIADVDNIFLNDLDDYRLYLIEQTGTKYESSIKYRRVDDSQGDKEGTAIPVLRINEIYHTLIECHYKKGNVAEAIRLLKELRAAKGCKRNITSISSELELYDILINDARREFIGEGQLFFMYKRLNRPILCKDGEYTPTEERLTFKIPDSQNIY